MTSLAIVIVAYNSGEFLRRCLDAVGSDWREVVVVDDASPDGRTAGICAEFEHVRLIERQRNDGFATAANEGIAATTAPWVLLLNADAWPLDDGIEALLGQARRDPRVAALGPLLVDERRREARSTIRAPLSPAALAVWAAMPGAVSGAYGLARRVATPAAPRQLRAGEFIQGAALLLRRRAFDAVGGLDESFFMYGEDADLCTRLRDAGWGIGVYPDAVFVHVGGASTRTEGGRMRIELMRSWLRLIARRDGIARADRARRWLRRALLLRGDRQAAAWAASAPVVELLGPRE